MVNKKPGIEVRFDEICNDVSTRSIDPKNSGYDRYVGLEHLDTLEPRILRWGSSIDVSSTVNIFKKNQILFGRRNWYLRRVAVANFDGICSADIYVLEPIDGKIIKEFLPIFMHSEQFFKKNLMYSTGSMSTRVKWANLSKQKFLIPLIDNQKKIISIMQKIDNGIENTQNLLEKTVVYKKTKAQDLLSKGIGSTKFNKHVSYFGKTLEIPENGIW